MKNNEQKPEIPHMPPRPEIQPEIPTDPKQPPKPEVAPPHDPSPAHPTEVPAPDTGHTQGPH